MGAAIIMWIMGAVMVVVKGIKRAIKRERIAFYPTNDALVQMFCWFPIALATGYLGRMAEQGDIATSQWAVYLIGLFLGVVVHISVDKIRRYMWEKQYIIKESK